MSADLSHITLDEAAGKADCSVCQMGVTAPPSFGGVPRADMLAAFVVQHSVHTKAGNASGLTAAGNATKAARDYLTSESDAVSVSRQPSSHDPRGYRQAGRP